VSIGGGQNGPGSWFW